MDFSVSRDVRLLVLILVIIVAHKARGQRELLCSKATDLAIILDSSLDIGNEWQNMLAFSNAMVDAFNIGANKTRVGIITFSQNPELYLGFNDLQGENVTEEAIKGRIATIKHQRNPGRFIDRALRFADKELFVARKGMRVDPDILRVLVVVVGGRQTRNGFPVNLRQVARPLRLKRVDMFAVGVPQLAEIDDEDLIQMASKPENVMTAKTFAESVSLVEEIAKLACGIKILECFLIFSSKSAFLDPQMSVPVLSKYATSLEGNIKNRYIQKIEKIGIDPATIPDEELNPECLPPIEQSDLFSFLVLETSHYTNDQFKNYKSLEAYNQVVSGFVASVKGRIVSDKYVVVAKVRHSQRMNDPLVDIWLIKGKDGRIFSAHCLGCKAGLAESCSHIASVLFYIECWTRINGKLACTQVKCSWLLPTYLKKRAKAKVAPSQVNQAAMLKTTICICNEKATMTDRLIECHNVNCSNGNFFHLKCLGLKRMPNNSKTTWLCNICRGKKGNTMPCDKPTTSTSTTPITNPKSPATTSNLSDDDDNDSEDEIEITKVSTSSGSVNKYAILANLNNADYDIISDPAGWLTSDIIQYAQVLIKEVNPAIEGLQRPTLGRVRNFDVVSSEFIQILHTGSDHWVCVSSLGCPPGYVHLYDSLYHDVISQEIEEQTNDLLGGSLISLDFVPVQQQSNGSDCGVFSIAFATCLAFATNPSHFTFDIPKMRSHLLSCLKDETISMFPSF
ncbi:predicted protein [Nematostella vectensis]|uniref:Uncharacterized protein n=1 Tax=Nematostella vectensis TaxID=45351 RepID=A7RHL2_NEMVE|nr:predicted protein [Nematostella vectensis]|eukprot:XP_001640935.1 predicted protein [Nematostella vectensis]